MACSKERIRIRNELHVATEQQTLQGFDAVATEQNTQVQRFDAVATVVVLTINLQPGNDCKERS